MSSFDFNELAPGYRGRGKGEVKHGRCSECGRPALFRSRSKKANRRLHSDRRHNLCANCNKKLADATTTAS